MSGNLIISSVEKSLFEGINIDYTYIFIGKYKLARNKSGIFNQVRDYFKIKGKKLDEKFISWLKELYSFPDNGPVEQFENIIHQWQDSLYATIKPSLYGHMLRIYKHGGTVQFYILQNKVQLSLIGSIDSPSLYSLIARQLQYNDETDDFCALHGINHPLNKTILQIEREIKEAYLAKLIPVVKEVSVLRNTDDDYCLAYYDLNSGNPNSKTPAWDSFMSQFGTKEMADCFRAWVYSVFVGDNYGRQICWLFGKGKTGKSAVGNAIYNRLSAINEQICTTLEVYNNIDKFSTSSYINKRFTLNADSINYTIVRLPIVKNLTGNDYSSIRKMGQEKKEAKLYSKIMSTSNGRPWVDLDRPEEVSRILFFELDYAKCKEATENWNNNGLGDWQKYLATEIDDFIAQCKPCYDEYLSEDGHNLIPYEGMIEILGAAKFFTYQNINNWWENCLMETGNMNDIIKFDDIFDDFRRFANTALATHKGKVLLGRSIAVHVNKKGITIETLKVANKLFIRGFKFKEDNPEKRITLTNLIDDEINTYKEQPCEN